MLPPQTCDIFHCSLSYGMSGHPPLEPLGDGGHPVGSLHPLGQKFAELLQEAETAQGNNQPSILFDESRAKAVAVI